MICIHCEHQFVGGAFIRSSGPGTSVAMRRCPKCECEFVAPPKLRAPGKVVALQAEIDALRATVARLRRALQNLLEDTQHARHRCDDVDCPVAAARAALAAKGDEHE